MLCADIMRQAGKISDVEWSFFLRGAAGVEKVKGGVGRGVGQLFEEDKIEGCWRGRRTAGMEKMKGGRLDKREHNGKCEEASFLTFLYLNSEI